MRPSRSNALLGCVQIFLNTPGKGHKVLLRANYIMGVIMGNFVRLGVFGWCVMMATGCSSTATIQMQQALTQNVDHTAVASLTAASHEEAAAPNEAMQEAIQRLKGQLFGRLVSEGVFSQVVHVGTDSEYVLDVKMLSATEVSQGARIFLGVLAGSNALVAEVKLFDAQSNLLLTSFQVTGESASHPLSSENDMDDAIREVVDEIILALQ